MNPTEKQIVEEVEAELNERGKPWDLRFEVASNTLQDGGWLQIFIHSDAKKRNSAAERQIIADVESDLTDKFKQELLLVPVESIARMA